MDDAMEAIAARGCVREILPNLYFRKSGNFKGLQRLFLGFALLLIKGDSYAAIHALSLFPFLSAKLDAHSAPSMIFGKPD